METKRRVAKGLPRELDVKMRGSLGREECGEERGRMF